MLALLATGTEVQHGDEEPAEAIIVQTAFERSDLLLPYPEAVEAIDVTAVDHHRQCRPRQKLPKALNCLLCQIMRSQLHDT